jgi:hypothetical protein
MYVSPLDRVTALKCDCGDWGYLSRPLSIALAFPGSSISIQRFKLVMTELRLGLEILRLASKREEGPIAARLCCFHIAYKCNHQQTILCTNRNRSPLDQPSAHRVTPLA